MSIVSEIKARGLAAVREWAIELDGAEPARVSAKLPSGAETTTKPAPLMAISNGEAVAVKTPCCEMP